MQSRHKWAVTRAALVLAFLIAACNPSEVGSYAASNKADCLPDVTLVDQNNARVSLPSLKGKLVLVNFIYTSCSGPCPLLTSRFGGVADAVSSRMGREVTLVSITLDPERDTPAKLAAFARQHGASRGGWLFLTGTPAQIERVLAAFELRREREPDGSVTHTVSAFLLGRDGRQIRQYNATSVKPQTVAADIDRALVTG